MSAFELIKTSQHNYCQNRWIYDVAEGKGYETLEGLWGHIFFLNITKFSPHFEKMKLVAKKSS